MAGIGRILVVGAGFAGIGAGLAALRTGRDVEVLERELRPGGLAQTDEVDGFLFDQAGHVLHFRSEGLERALRRSGLELTRFERRAAVLVDDAVVPYPVQYNLHALEPSSRRVSLLEDLEQACSNPDRACSSFAELLLSSWGEGLVELFFRPYNEKLWGRGLEELPPDCAGPYLPAVDLELARLGARERVDYAGYHPRLSYPSSGRLGDAAVALAAPLADRIALGDELVGLDLREREAHTSAGRVIPYDLLVSTAPLPDLVALAGIAPAGRSVLDATETVNVRVALRGAMRTPLHWVYVPDRNLPFHRIGFPWNLSPRTCPDGCVSLSVEYTPPAQAPRVPAGDIAGAVVDLVRAAGLVKVDEVLGVTEAFISPAYVVNRSSGREVFAELRETLAEHGVRLAGRFGTWDYLSMEEAFLSGASALEPLRELARA
jgi:protoporphyrinogen oxidase